jgi:hypothetical protein
MTDEDFLVTIEFYSGGKLLASVWSRGYPAYQTGQQITLELIPTRREKTRRPSHDFTQKAYVVENVHHYVRQVESGAESDFFLKMDVMLSELKDEKAEEE